MEIITRFANISNMNENHSWVKTINKRGVQTIKFNTAGNECLHGTVPLIAEIKKIKKRENAFSVFWLSPLGIF